MFKIRVASAFLAVGLFIGCNLQPKERPAAPIAPRAAPMTLDDARAFSWRSIRCPPWAW